ncbi:MAG: Ig-like domain-containing protein [Eubacteriales bacterium]|nr:Ig-like domain-containing protein [Eubacteriales bacterium]
MKKQILFLSVLLLLASCQTQRLSSALSSSSPSSSFPSSSSSSSSSPISSVDSSDSSSSSSTSSSEEIKPVLTLSYDKEKALDLDHTYAVGDNVQIEALLTPTPSSPAETVFSLREGDENSASIDSQGGLSFLAPKEEIVVLVSVPSFSLEEKLSFTSVDPNVYYRNEVQTKLSKAYSQEKNLVKTIREEGNIVEETSFFTDQKETIGKNSEDSSRLYRRVEVLENGTLDSYRFDKEDELAGFSTKEADTADVKKISSLVEGDMVSLASLFGDPQSGFFGKEHLGSDLAKTSLKVEKKQESYTLSSWTEEDAERSEVLSLTFAVDGSLSSFSFQTKSGEEEQLFSYQLSYGTRGKSPNPLRQEDFYYTDDLEVGLESINGRYEIGNTYSLKVLKGKGNDLVDPLEITSVSGKDEEENPIAELSHQKIKILHEGEFQVTVHTLRSGIEKTLKARAVYPPVTQLNVDPDLTTGTLEQGQTMDYKVEVLPSKAKQGVAVSVSDTSLATVTETDESHYRLQVKVDADITKKLTVTFTAKGKDSDGKSPVVSFTYSLKAKTVIADLKNVLTSTTWKVQGEDYGACSLVFRADGTGTCTAETIGIMYSDIEAPFHYAVNGQELSLVPNDDDTLDDPYIDRLTYVSDQVQVHFTDTYGTDETLTFTK